MTDTGPKAGAPGGFRATERGSYRAWTREILRYADLDPVGHVNNNAYGSYIENARTMLFHRVHAALPGGPPDGLDWVVRRLEIDYLRELRYPGEVEVGLAATRLGNSSMALCVGVFAADYCAAASVGISVCFDTRARAAARIPDPVRAALREIAGVGI